MLQVRTDGIYDSETGLKQQLEFGNVEQISLLKEHESKLSEFIDGHIVEPDIEISADINFKCICGTYLYTEEIIPSDDDFDKFINKKITCHKCKQVYVIDRNDDNDLIVKFNK